MGTSRERADHAIGDPANDNYWSFRPPKLSVAAWLAQHTGLPAMHPYDHEDLSQPPTPLAEYPPVSLGPQPETEVHHV